MRFSVNAFRMSSEERNATTRLSPKRKSAPSPKAKWGVPKGDTKKGSE